MLKEIIEPVARNRFVLPLLLTFALLGGVITETTYRGAKDTMDGAIALTDTRIKAAELFQSLSELEIATHLYLHNGASSDAERQKSAAQRVQRLQNEAFDLVKRLDTGNAVPADTVRALIYKRLEQFDAWQQLAATGQREEAQRQSMASTSLRGWVDLRNAFETLLQGTAAIQRTTRVSLYDALMRNRLGIHLLMVLTALATMLFVRSLREADRLKEEERSRLTSIVDERTADLRELTDHLVTAREDERARLARELHDEMGGLFTSMKLELSRLRRIAPLPQGAGERLAAVDARLTAGIALKRRIIENLRPSSLDQLGLSAAIELLCNEVAANLGVPVHTQLEPVRFASAVELTIYRLVQESLTNISKYAQCREVYVSLRTAHAGQVEVQISDDGRGFDPASVKVGRHGLLGMRFRVESHAGSLMIRSAPGAGTVVTALLPTESQIRDTSVANRV